MTKMMRMRRRLKRRQKRAKGGEGQEKIMLLEVDKRRERKKTIVVRGAM